MKKMGKRLLSAALAVCLGLGLMNVSALAADDDTSTALQGFTLTTSAVGSSDAGYTVTYTANLQVSDDLAKALAVNCTETEKLGKLRFTCTLTDGLVAQLGSVSKSDFTFNGGNYFTLVENGVTKEGNSIKIVYKLDEKKISTWADMTTEKVKEDIQTPTLTMSATKTASSDRISTAMDSNGEIKTTGTVVLSMEDGKQIPFFGGTTLTLAEATAVMTFSTGVTRYPISVETVEKGTVTANRASASAGTKVTLTVIPDSGYRLASLTVTDRNGNEIAVTANADGTWSFIMPAGKVTVTPAWRIAVADPDETGLSLLLNTDDHAAFMIGTDTGDFLPEDNMTRAQAAMVFYRLLRDQDVEAAPVFDDVPENAWYAEAVNTLAALGIVEGYAQGLYGPDNSITRAEFATIAARFAQASTDNVLVFSDVSETDWSYPYITTAAAYGWIIGSGGAFFPTGRITRMEAATIVNRMLGRLCDEDAVDAGAGTRFPDVSETHWGFYQIVEATTTHDYVMNGDRSKETWVETE